ncbi:MAG: helix-turn-helix domain-containing protein [Chitinophagaceae bacterium]
MKPNELQQELFSHLKASLPPHLSLADELCSLLDISHDSAYRRIRGEKPISLSELKKISEHYNLSLDQLLQLNSDTVVFRAPDLLRKDYPFKDVLKSMLVQVKYFNSFAQKEIFYICKDMPIWQFYLFPELAAFKTFVWARTIHNETALSGKLFSLEEYMFEDCFELGRQIIAEYNQVPSVELWNEESINSTLSQLRFYKESGGFRYQKDIERVTDSFVQTITHLRLQTEQGMKFMPGDSDLLHRAPVQLYINEIVIGSNTILAKLDGMKLSFIPYNVFSFMLTKDAKFNESIFNGFNTLKSRSTLISGTGEKERNRFFTSFLERINQLRS